MGDSPVECERVAGRERELLESDLHRQHAIEDKAVVTTVVADGVFGRTRAPAHRIGDFKELCPRLRVRSEQFPADALFEIDGPASITALDKGVLGSGGLTLAPWFASTRGGRRRYGPRRQKGCPSRPRER